MGILETVERDLGLRRGAATKEVIQIAQMPIVVTTKMQVKVQGDSSAVIPKSNDSGQPFLGNLELTMKLIGAGTTFGVSVNGVSWGNGLQGAALPAGSGVEYTIGVLPDDRVNISGASIFRAELTFQEIRNVNYTQGP